MCEQYRFATAVTPDARYATQPIWLRRWAKESPLGCVFALSVSPVGFDDMSSPSEILLLKVVELGTFFIARWLELDV